MSKNILSLIILPLVFGSLWAADITVEQQAIIQLKSFDNNQSTLQLTDPDFSIGTISYPNGDYDHIMTDMSGQIRLIGAPDLPSTTMMLAVPATGALETSITYQNLRVETDVNLAPFQPTQLEAQGNTSNFLVDREIYEQDAWFPENPVILHDRFTMRDLTLANVEVTPFQYNPARRELRVYEGLEVTLNHEDPLEATQRPISRFFEPIYQDLVPNSTLVLEPNYQTPCVLFIHTSNTTVELVLDYLMAWRHEKGFEVHSVSTTQTGSSNSAIKNYIQTAYDTWENPPEFVVLVGDAGGSFNIPTWTESWSGYSGEGDIPYVNLAGGDYVADAFVGRIPFGSTTEFTSIVTKIMNYEKTPYMDDTTWYTRALLVGDQSSSGLSTIMTNRNIGEYLEHLGYQDNIEVYGGSFVSGIANGINSGVSFFNYRGYIGMSGWGNSNTSSLSNGAQTPFVTILTCGTGSFSGDSRSEQFLRVGTSSVPKGAIGAVGTATSGTHTLYNNCVNVGIYYGIFADELYYAGAALQRGRLSLNQTYPTNSNNYVQIFSHWNNLMGDPTTELWTGTPQNLTVSALTDIPSSSQFMDVSVADDLGNPVEKAWVSLTGTDVFVTSYTDEDGSTVLALPAVLPANMILTVSRHNSIPSQTTISVADNFVVLIDAAELVETTGNGDAVVNPGETVTFNWSFSNHSAAAVDNVSIDVTGEDGISTNLSYPTLAASQSVSLSDQSFMVPHDFPGMARYDVAISVDVGGTVYTDHRRFDVIAPYIQINDLGETGAPPYSFDPGEISDLVLYSRNIGTLASSNLSAILRCNDPNISILDSTAFFSDAEAGALSDNVGSPFQVNVNTQVTVGVQIPFQVEFTDDLGFIQTMPFLMPIGTPGESDPTGPDAGGYFIYSDQDLAYALAPTFDWIEIVPGMGGFSGSILSINDNGSNQEDIETITIPFDFGFYGVDYNQISICSNGYMALGVSESALFRNYPVPGPLGPSPMIAAFWDDLVMGGGDIYTYYNSTDHYFVIEYYNMQNAYSGSTEQFQVILYDGDYYGSTDGNGDIKIQYHTYNNDNSVGVGWGSSAHGQYSTTGLEDHTGQIGIQYTFNNSWAPTAHPLVSGSALLFTTRTDAILPCPGWARADINHDGQKNVQDLVILVNAILQSTSIGECEYWAADMSGDSTLSVGDVVLMVHEVLGLSMDRRISATNGTAEFVRDGGSVYLRSNTPVEAFSLRVSGNARPTVVPHDGLTVITKDLGYELRMLGYWTGPVENNVELLRFGSDDYEITSSEAADGAGEIMKSSVLVIPERFTVNSVYPNPFNPTVNISYSLPTQEEVSVSIFNALGQEVSSQRSTAQAGEHLYSWDGTNALGRPMSSGVYFARISAGDNNQMIKLTLLR